MVPNMSERGREGGAGHDAVLRVLFAFVVRAGAGGGIFILGRGGGSIAHRSVARRPVSRPVPIIGIQRSAWGWGGGVVGRSVHMF